ncbi:MAG: hypothetical protein KDM63_09470, partial [Verrucomicrobiae bacterium]|nr:hypothetical protein [Verrucomicrobiae bacterium]
EMIKQIIIPITIAVILYGLSGFLASSMLGRDPEFLPMVLVAILIPSFIMAVILDIRRRRRNPGTLGYVWGYFLGSAGIYTGSIGLCVLVSLVGEAYGDLTLRKILGAVMVFWLLPSIFVIKRRKSAWILLTIFFVLTTRSLGFRGP